MICTLALIAAVLALVASVALAIGVWTIRQELGGWH